MPWPWSRKSKIEVKKQRPYIETDHESGPQQPMSEMARRDFFRRSTGAGIAVASQILPIKDLTPPKDPIVEELTRRVKEQEAQLRALKEQPVMLPYPHSLNTAFCSYTSFTDMPYTIARNRIPIRKM